jgi:hypothetical protein
MKRILIALIIITGFKAKGQDYKMQINDTAFDISLDKSYEISLKGQKIKFIINSRDTLKYDDGLYSFRYSKEYKVSKNPVDTGIEQITILTAEGNGIIIQKFSNLNPTKLNEIMLSEITKESLNYGYELKRNDYNRTLKSGQAITVNKAVLTYKDNVYKYEVASIGKKDEGIIIITMILSDNSYQGQNIVNLLWDSLIYK